MLKEPNNTFVASKIPGSISFLLDVSQNTLNFSIVILVPEYTKDNSQNFKHREEKMMLIYQDYYHAVNREIIYIQGLTKHNVNHILLFHENMGIVIMVHSQREIYPGFDKTRHVVSEGHFSKKA